MSQTNWNGGAGDVNNPSNWTPAAPQNGDVATIGTGEESWRRLFGQRPAEIKWIPAGLC